MDYREQLQQQEWKDKRNRILVRDNFECVKCHIKRSDFLGLDYNFGIMTYDEFISQGYDVIIDSKNNPIEIRKNGNTVRFKNLTDTTKAINLDQLSFAKKWKERNKFEFPSLELICFQSNTLDENKYFDLNIHHRFYIKGRKAWEYDDDTFMTLCVNCHKEEHETNTIPIIDEQNNIVGYSEICDRCYGKGVLPEYNYFKSGICFKCHGLGNLFNSDHFNS